MLISKGNVLETKGMYVFRSILKYHNEKGRKDLFGYRYNMMVITKPPYDHYRDGHHNTTHTERTHLNSDAIIDHLQQS